MCRWQAGEWQRCSAGCGVGLQQRMVTCQRALVQRGDQYVTVDTDLCDPRTKPVTARDCRADVLCHQWQTGPWSQVAALLSTICAFLVDDLYFVSATEALSDEERENVLKRKHLCKAVCCFLYYVAVFIGHITAALTKSVSLH